MSFLKTELNYLRTLIFAFLFLPRLAFGELYLIGEDFLAGKNKWKIVGAFSYLSISDVSPRLFVSDSVVNSSGAQSQLDQALGTVGIGYGLLSGLELSVNGLYEKSWNRFIVDGKNASYKEQGGLNSVSVGLSFQAVRDQVFPALILFGDVKAVEWFVFPQDNSASRREQFFKSISLGGLIYRRVDPVILSLAFGYNVEAERKSGGFSRRLPNTISLQPVMNFIINSEVSLFTGISWSQSNFWVHEDNKPGTLSTNTRFRTGVNYEAFKDLVMGFNASLNGSGVVYPILGLSFVYDF